MGKGIYLLVLYMLLLRCLRGIHIVFRDSWIYQSVAWKTGLCCRNMSVPCGVVAETMQLITDE